MMGSIVNKRHDSPVYWKNNTTIKTIVVHAINNNDTISKDLESDSRNLFNRNTKEILQRSSTLYGTVYSGPLTQSNQSHHINKTKIVGFVSSKYVHIAMRWYDRLQILGYDNHYIICTEKETVNILLLQQSTTSYRMETAFLATIRRSDTKKMGFWKSQARVLMLFSRRWQYIVDQLKLGYHILITDVDNIFSSYYSMNQFELSEFDIYHALETRHPEDVYHSQGFVLCGGMGWFRSSSRTIRYVQEIVDQCGIICDDQILLNRLIAYVFQIQWNRNSTEHQEVTVHTNDTNITMEHYGRPFDRLVGLVMKGFTGYSVATGVKIQVWDRDFAYRGKVDPSICPKSNWVSMPFVLGNSPNNIRLAKLSSYDVWDSYCHNPYSTRNNRTVL
jgi:Nucleotide-diphospho-sugar transferase